MPHDTHLTFADIFPDPRDLKRQILEILPHVRERSRGESPTFTFLAIRQAPQRDGSGHSSGAAMTPVDNSDDIQYASPSDKSPSSAWSTTSSESRSDVDNLGNTLREFTADDWKDPELQLSLVNTTDKMGFGSSRSYIAVSYCWPSEEDAHLARGDLGLPVTICGPDGDCRPSKALPHILRRAVKHAGSLSRKYIWIDQECINQDDSDEKEAAIQCMDIVYRSSESHILCLLDLEITDQEQISLLEALHQCNMNGIGNRFYSMARSMLGMKGTPEMARILAEILNMVAANRWFFRAWIMHERLCAATLRNTELWMTCAPGLTSFIPGEVCLMGGYQLQDAQELARHLETNEKEQDGGGGGPAGALQSMAAHGYETPGWVHTLRSEILFGEFGDDECQQAAQSLRAAISHFESSYKAIQPAAHRRRLAASVRSGYGSLQIIHLLEPMGCLYPSDKIAMLANICDWSHRLEAREIEKMGWSFSLCLWIMAMANGDGSFFCPEVRCTTNASGTNQTLAWVPRAETKLGGMKCSGLIDFVSMRLHPHGLHVEGWLWRSERFIDLSDLKSMFQDIDKHAEPRIQNLTGAGIHHDFSLLPHAYGEEDDEDNGSKMRKFFWALLVKLSTLQEHECANLVWEAVKLRYAGGFYGRSLQTIPIATLDKVIDPETGNYIACYESLNIAEEDENDDDYLSWGPIAPSVVDYLRQNCVHREGEGEGEGEGDEPSHALLGRNQQLAGLEWIRSAILRNGGLTIGRMSPVNMSRDSHAATDDEDAHNHDDDDKTTMHHPSTGGMSILDLPADSSRTHAFTLHREVRKYKPGDGKAMHLLHPFDVWLQDSPTHTDAPFCWAVSLQPDGGIQTEERANALFNIGSIKRMSYVFNWPDVYTQDTWGAFR